MKMRRNLFLVLLSLTLLSFVVACSKQADSTDSQGHAIRLSDYKGKWVVINYWATWCKPCLQEMPALNALYQGNRKKIVVLGVSYDQLSNNEIKKIANKMSIEYPMLSTFPLQKLGISHLDVLPITFILNPKGQLVKTLKGPQTKKQFRHALGLSLKE